MDFNIGNEEFDSPIKVVYHYVTGIFNADSTIFKNLDDVYEKLYTAKIKYPKQSYDPETGENVETREGLHHLVGRKGYVVNQLNPIGVVKIDSETWSACSNNRRSIAKGTEVTVFSVDGAVLNVDTSDSIG